MRISVSVNGVVFRCTSADPWDHNGKTCPIHEDEESAAYAPTLGRKMKREAIEAAFDVQLGRPLNIVPKEVA